MEEPERQTDRGRGREKKRGREGKGRDEQVSRVPMVQMAMAIKIFAQIVEQKICRSQGICYDIEVLTVTGSSTHNHRIERLWRDLHRSVTKLYYELFYHLESLQSLDPLNELHLFALCVSSQNQQEH